MVCSVSLLPPHRLAKKYLMVLWWFIFVWASVYLGVCPSKKSALTFDSVDGPAQNFQGLLNSLQVIFGWVTRTQEPSGSGLDPQKGGFCQIYLLPGFWGRWVVSHLFRIGTMRQTKLWKLNFDLLPTALENGVRMRAWPWGRSKILGFQHFS